MKKLQIIFLLLLSINVYAQDADKIATLVATGQGKTTEEATGNALRSAIEQAFGTFISSKTEILNDSLIRDEIVSVTNGNIQKYELLSTQTLPNGLVANTVKATVSISKLTTFCESKGLSVEFKGGLFAANILLQDLSDKSELIAWQNTKKILYDYIATAFDYTIEASQPVLVQDTTWRVPLTIKSKFNTNMHTALDVLYDFMKAVSLSDIEAENYVNLGKGVHPLVIALAEEKFGKFYFRNKLVRNEISLLPYYIFQTSLTQIKVNNGIQQLDLIEFLVKGRGKEVIKVTDNFDSSGSYLSEFGQAGLWKETRVTNELVLFVKNEIVYNLQSRSRKTVDEIFLNKEIVKNLIYIMGHNNRNGGLNIEGLSGGENLNEFFKSDQFTESVVPIDQDNVDYVLSEGSNNFKFLKRITFNPSDKLLLNNFKNEVKPYISFINIIKNGELFTLSFNDKRSLNELKQISKYEVSKQ
jgi:hypothetical protein